MIKYELYKICKTPLFVCSIIVAMILSVFLLYRQYSEKYTNTTIDGQKYEYSGFSKIEFDKATSARFENRLVNDEFIVDVQLFSHQYAFDRTPPIWGTSLHQYYLALTPTEKEVGVLLQSVTDVFKNELPVYRYTKNWEVIINAVSYAFSVISIISIIIISRIFCSEYESNSCVITMATKYGRNKVPICKIITSLIVVSFVYLFITLFTILIFGAFYGFENANADIRVISNGNYIHMNTALTCFELLIFEIIICYIALLIIISLTLLVSSFSPNGYIALIISVILTYLPNILQFNKSDNEILQKLYRIYPINMSTILLNDWTAYKFILSVFFYVGIIFFITVPLFNLLAYQIYRKHRIA